MLPIAKIFDKINNRQDSGEPYLALAISGEKVQSAIWTFDQGQSKVLAFGSSEQWGGDSPEELVAASDTSIAAAVANLPAVSAKQPSSVILGLPESWVEGDGVKEAQAKILQTICRKLLLKPQGFIVTLEAISHYLKVKEGDLVSVILVSREETQICVSLIIQGKFLGSRVVGRSNSLVLDLEEGLLRFNYQGVFPPSIILVAGESQQEARQTLVAYPWVDPEKQKKIAFLQLPKVDFAPDNLEIEAVILAGSRDMVGGKTTGLNDQKENLESKKEIDFSLPEEDFGFVKEKDIVEEQELIPVAEIPPSLSLSPKTKVFKKGFSAFIGFLSKIITFIKHIKPKFSFPRKGLVFFGLGLVFVFFLLILFYLKLVKAQVNLLVQPKLIEKEIEFTLSSKISEPDIGKKIVPILEATTDVSGSKSDTVKGRKTVGEKATGEVFIYNGSDNKKTFSKGTVIKGPENLIFILNEGLSVPARTTDISSSPPVDKWGEGKVAVIAQDIGTQFNIAANSNLSLESNTGTASAVIVRNSSDFSGGTSREITAVAKEDRENLQKALLAELQVQAEQDLKTKIADNNFLSDSLLLINKTDRFDHEIGDEADQLSLEEAAAFSVSYFKNETITDLIRSETASLVPDGFNPNPVKEEINIIAKDKTKNIYSVRVSLSYHPEISSSEIVPLLKRKTLSQAKKILGNQKYVAGYEIQFTPKVFSFLSIFPLESKNIIININSI